MFVVLRVTTHGWKPPNSKSHCWVRHNKCMLLSKVFSIIVSKLTNLPLFSNTYKLTSLKHALRIQPKRNFCFWNKIEIELFLVYFGNCPFFLENHVFSTFLSIFDKIWQNPYKQSLCPNFSENLESKVPIRTWRKTTKKHSKSIPNPNSEGPFYLWNPTFFNRVYFFRNTKKSGVSVQ